MIIHKVKCKNFKSFRQETEIDFDRLKGLYKVTGKIGSGKTTIGEIIIYALFGSITGKNNTDLISWGEKHGTVEIYYTCHGDDIYIKRELNSYGQSPVTVTVNGDLMCFTDKRNAQVQLESQYMDVTRTIMELLCIISFNNFTSLSTLNTKQTREFLNYVFNFNVLSQYVDACKSEQNKIKGKIQSTQAGINIYKNQLTKYNNIIKQTCGDDKQIHQTIQQLKQNIQDRKSKDNESLQQLKQDLQQYHVRLGEIKAAGIAKKKEIDLIKKGICPTCGAPIDDSNLSTKEQERKILLDSYGDINAHIRILTAQISQIDSEMTKYISEQENVVKSQENELLKISERNKINQQDIVGTEKQLIQDENLLKEEEINLAQYNRLYGILANDIRQSIINSFIPALNSNIQQISNMMSLEFVPEFDVDFSCSVVKNGQTIPTSSLSTGQLKLVDMVIILGVLNSILTRINTNIIFLDELFSNLDAGARTEMIGVLRCTLPKDSSIFIVSHQDMEDALFDGQLKMQLVKNKEGQLQTSIEM